MVFAQKPASVAILCASHAREPSADKVICYLKLAYAFVSKIGVDGGARVVVGKVGLDLRKLPGLQARWIVEGERK